MKYTVLAIVIAAVALGACRRTYAYTPIVDECKTYGVGCESDKFYRYK